MQRVGFVYILASKKNGTLYTGVASDLARRIEQRSQELLMQIWSDGYVSVARGIGRLGASVLVFRHIWFGDSDTAIVILAAFGKRDKNTIW